MNPAEEVAIGTTSVRVTRMGLGTVPIGGWPRPVAAAEAQAIMRRSFELGLRLFDTAPHYGLGLAERRLGEAIRQLPRDEIVVVTKVGRLLRPVSFASKVGHVLQLARARDVNGWSLIKSRARNVIGRVASRGESTVRLGYPFDKGEAAMGEIFDFSYDGVMRSVEESLQRLGADRVDMLLIHDPDRDFAQAMTGAYRALDKLRSEGVVGAIGVGMNQAAMLARFAREGDFDCFLVAGRYTLLDQTALQELLPICLEKRISVMVGGVYNSGILANPNPGANFDYEPANRRLLEQAQRLQAVCARYEVPLMAAAIQFPLTHPAVASVLTGAASVAELEQNVSLFCHRIPPELWRELQNEGLLPRDAPLQAAIASAP